MAIHGLSLAEVDRYILKADPAHPDNIKAEYNRLTATMTDEAEKASMLAKIEADAGQPTVFLLGNLLHEDRVFFGDMAGGMEQTPQGSFRMTPKNTQKASETVRRSLRGWENFQSASGKPLTFTTSPGVGERGQPRSFVSIESMAMMHMDIIKELAERVLEVNGVTGVVEKKWLSALRQESDHLLQAGHATAALTETKSNEGAESQASEDDTGN